MSATLPSPPLLLITDRRHTALPLLEIVDQALGAGCRWIMVREKDLDRAGLVSLAAGIVARAEPVGARIVVNGDVDAAAEAGAQGVHLQSAAAIAEARRRLGPDALIGLSAHGIADLSAGQAQGADYATLSPIFATDSKPGYGPQLGVAGLAEACAAVALPVIALAGVTPANARACRQAGAAGVATMGRIMNSEYPAKQTRKFIAALS